MKKLIYFFSLLLSQFVVEAQENITFQKPSPEILALADYQRAPSVSLDSQKKFMLLSFRNTYKTLDDLNQEELRLGGLRINPVTNISSTVTYINNLKLKNLTTNREYDVTGLPENPKITNISWSPNESKIAFTHTTNKGVSLWVLDVETGNAKAITSDNLNANLGNPFSWKDNTSLLIKVLPKNKPALINTTKDLPKGPTVSISDGSKSQNRTYQDLLKNPIDEANFENIVTSELYIVSTDGTQTFFKEAAMYAGESISPDTNYVMITTLQKPFSYIVPLNRFPQITSVYDWKGTLIQKVNNVALTEIMPKGFSSVRKGKRSMSWRNDMPATLFYVEALDEGDQSKKVDFRDELFLWNAPFTTQPKSIAKTIQRYGGIIWGDENMALVYDSWYDTRNEKVYLINPSTFNDSPKIISDRNSQDIYSDPGNFETKKNKYGRQTLVIENNNLYLIGDGHTKEGQFPFIDALNLNNFQKKRLYLSKLKNQKEDILSLENIQKGEALVMLQSKNEYPNYYIRNYKNNKVKAITSFKNPFESIKNVYKEVIKYKRKDGVELSGTLYLPAGYDFKKKEKLPLLIWAYPAEYKDKNTAGQNDKNPNEFTFPNYGSFVYWVTKGYAVLDDASFPIIGEDTTEPNDTFIPQLVSNAEAAIDAVDNLGYINRKKVAIGGHSYGAFMTANLLTHSNLFACGIARSGAYNRTLTPFGFQSEQRNYWDIPSIYNEMSPFMNADKMKTPLLLVHGDADNNPGTFTLQSERYFQALKGLGAPVRLVLLPKEAHGYVAKENILHLLWEQDQFLEKYLKNE